MIALIKYIWSWGADQKAGTVNSRHHKVEPANLGVSPHTPLTFEEAADHLSKGYENTQRTVQYIDAKSGVTIALNLGIFSLLGNITIGLQGKLGDSALVSYPTPICYIIWIITAIILTIGLCGFASLHFCFKAVKPNGLPSSEKFTILFPASNPNDSKAKILEYLARIGKGENRQFIINEYTSQLLLMGNSIHSKIKNLRIAINLLSLQGILVLTMLVLIGFANGLGILPKKNEPTKSILTAKDKIK